MTEKRITVNPRYQLVFVDEDTSFLMDEGGYIALQGVDVVTVLRILQRAPVTIDMVLRQAMDTLTPSDTRAIVTQLMKDGIAIEYFEGLDQPETAFWENQGLRSDQVTHRLQKAHVALLEIGSVDVAPLADRFLRMNIDVIHKAESAGTRADLTVVCTDDYARKEIEDFNREAWAAQQPWMLIKPVGAVAWLGPLIIPNQTACGKCLAAQLMHNRRAETYLRHAQGMATVPVTSVARLPITSELAFDLAALEITYWLAKDASSRLEKTLLTFDFANLNLETHHVRHLPECPICELRKAGPADSAASDKAGHRLRRPSHKHTGGYVRKV